MAPPPIPPTARLHLRPVQFADTPVGRDGEVLRLAGGLTWFAGVELIASEGGRRVAQRTVAIAGLDDALARLTEPQQQTARATLARLTAPRAPLLLGSRTLRLDQPQVAGILNLTPDSFSDGGAHMADPGAAAAAGIDMAAAGAALIDAGGESTRPNAPLVWEGEEASRVVPVVERLATAGALVSIDTRKALVMEQALAAGAAIVNDVSALLWDDRALELVTRAGCPVILMHSPDPKKGPHGGSGYRDVLLEVYGWLEARVAAVEVAGVPRSRIMIDPGLGFGKGLADNLALLNGLTLFHGLGCAVMLGASRKRMIGALSNEAPVGDRLGGSIALATIGAQAGVQLIRVHDVPETVQAIRVWRGLRDAALTAPAMD